MAFDLKDSRNQKLVLIVMVFVIGAYFWYARVYSPNVAIIEAKSAEHERILTDLRNVELKAKSFDALKTEYESLFEQYQHISSLLPDKRQLEGLLMQLHQSAVTTETEITSVTPQPPVPTGFYQTNAFRMEVAGNYHSLGRFFASIANYSFIANIRNVQFSAVPLTTGENADEKKTMTAAFDVDTYYASEDAAIQPLNF